MRSLNRAEWKVHHLATKVGQMCLLGVTAGHWGTLYYMPIKLGKVSICVGVGVDAATVNLYHRRP